jgi:hypothetical protein
VELAVIVLAFVVAGLVVVLVLSLRRRPLDGPGTGLVPSGQRALVPATGDGQPELDIVGVGERFELRLAEQPLMTLEPLRHTPDRPALEMGATFVLWLGSLLNSPSVVEFLTGQRWVLARVPETIRRGGQWLTTTDGYTKTIALEPGGTKFAEIADIARGGTAVGAAAALGPAVIGATASAFAYYAIDSALHSIRDRLDSIDDRLANAEMGTIRGAQDFLVELTEWGAPRSWPQQLRTELAIRRAELDPVCFVRRAEVDRLVREMVTRGQRFVGLSEEERHELAHETRVLSTACMVRAQLDLATTMLLLDSEDAPFGLERLNRSADRFVDEMEGLRTSFQAALDGKWPMILNPVAHMKAIKAAPVIETLIDELGLLTSVLSTRAETEVLLSVESGRIQLALPAPASPEVDSVQSSLEPDSAPST